MINCQFLLLINIAFDVKIVTEGFNRVGKETLRSLVFEDSMW
jgi:hypothetical protein